MVQHFTPKYKCFHSQNIPIFVPFKSVFPILPSFFSYFVNVIIFLVLARRIFHHLFSTISLNHKHYSINNLVILFSLPNFGLIMYILLWVETYNFLPLYLAQLLQIPYFYVLKFTVVFILSHWVYHYYFCFLNNLLFIGSMFWLMWIALLVCCKLSILGWKIVHKIILTYQCRKCLDEVFWIIQFFYF